MLPGGLECEQALVVIEQEIKLNKTYHLNLIHQWMLEKKNEVVSNNFIKLILSIVCLIQSCLALKYNKAAIHLEAISKKICGTGLKGKKAQTEAKSM